MRVFNLRNKTWCLCSDSLFTNSNWFAFDDDKAANERSMSSIASPSPNADGDGNDDDDDDDDVVIGEADEFNDTAASSLSVDMETEDSTSKHPIENPSEPEPEKSPAWVEWRETSESSAPSSNPDESTILSNGDVQIEKEDNGDDIDNKSAENSPGTSGDETTEKSPDVSGVEPTESSPKASGVEPTESSPKASGAERSENVRDSGPAESHADSESSGPESPQETKETEVAAEEDAKETKEAVKEPEKV